MNRVLVPTQYPFFPGTNVPKPNGPIAASRNEAFAIGGKMDGFDFSNMPCKPSEFLAIRSVRTMEFRWALVACIGVLLLGTLKGIVVAIIVSMIGLASQSAHPRVYVIGRKRGEDVLRPLSPEHGDDETFEGLLILRPEGRLFFVNAQEVGQQIQALVAKYQPRVLVLDMSRVSDIEYSALQMLNEGERRMTAGGVEVWLAGLNPSVLATVRNTDIDARLGRERMLFNARTAIERYKVRTATGGNAAWSASSGS